MRYFIEIEMRWDERRSDRDDDVNLFFYTEPIPHTVHALCTVGPKILSCFFWLGLPLRKKISRKIFFRTNKRFGGRTNIKRGRKRPKLIARDGSKKKRLTTTTYNQHGWRKLIPGYFNINTELTNLCGHSCPYDTGRIINNNFDTLKLRSTNNSSFL